MATALATSSRKGKQKKCKHCKKVLAFCNKIIYIVLKKATKSANIKTTKQRSKTMSNLTLSNVKEAATAISRMRAGRTAEISTAAGTIMPAVTAVMNELCNPNYKWRTVDGVAEDCVMEVDDVAFIMFGLIEAHIVITAKDPNSEGKKLYNYRGHVKTAQPLPEPPAEVNINMDALPPVATIAEPVATTTRQIAGISIAGADE